MSFGTDKELLLIREGYVARPVTLDKTSMTGITADDNGKYWIPQGSLLTGSDGGSLLDNPVQTAAVVIPSGAAGTATINSAIVVSGKSYSATALPTITISKGTSATTTIEETTGNFTVKLAVDSGNNIIATNNDVVDIINDDMDANSLFIAGLVSDSLGGEVAATVAATSVSGGVNASVSASQIDGVLYHSVDVTDGANTGAMVIAGYIDVDKMPTVPTATVKNMLPRITFARRD